MIYIGIDPGFKGGIAIVGAGPTLTVPMPIFQIKYGKTIKRTIDAHSIVRLLEPYSLGLGYVTIEDVHSMPEQGVASSFNFGMSTGILHGIIAGLKMPYTRVSPQRWKKRMLPDMGKDKDASIARAGQLFPEMSKVIGRKDGLAEALLLAEYGRQTQQTESGLIVMED